jgi:putative thioredoxin
MAQVELLARINGLDAAEAIAAADAAPEDSHLARAAADCEVAYGNYESAFTRLIAQIKRTTDEERKELREHLVGLFALVDPADPILTRARQQLASALF